MSSKKVLLGKAAADAAFDSIADFEESRERRKQESEAAISQLKYPPASRKSPKRGPLNLPDEKRCVWETRDKSRRCKRMRMIGLTVCYRHGGSTKASQAKSARAKLAIGMKKFTTPIAADDPEADPIGAFEIEFRRTVGHIRYLDEKLAALAEEELVYGITKEERKTATEFGGVDLTYEARANVYYELQMRERKHLVELEKLWIGAKLGAQKLQIQKSYVDLLDNAVTRIVSGLGRDPRSPEVRQVVREALALLPVADADGLESW